MNKIYVLGSMNMDMVLKVNNMPKVGETILANSMDKIPGGKGANQAVAAKRSGAQVYMVSKVGQDENGLILTKELQRDDINTDYIFKDEKEPTGVAIINVDHSGNNSIIVVSGANMTINHEEIKRTEKLISQCDIVIAQFETPEDMTIEAFKLAKNYGKVTLLNPAPAKKINEELLKYTDIIVPNETEAFVLTGVEVSDLSSARNAAAKFLDRGVKWVIITLGEKGAAVISKDFSEVVPAYKVNAIDTTAAGDSFIGGFGSKLNINELTKENVINAVKFGNKVSSIAVQRKGAQPSIPYLKEVMEIYEED